MSSASPLDHASHGSRGSRAAWALPLGVLAASTLGVIALAAAPARDDRMAAVYPPWWSAARAAASAAGEGDLQAVGGGPNILIVRSGRPRLAARLRASGALLVIDSRLASLCAAPTDRAPA
ncbi:MAG: hypothetical protein Q7T61_20770 [Caulobacter sp.]|nr:hypothetical protein [Caulobacter sp.]